MSYAPHPRLEFKVRSTCTRKHMMWRVLWIVFPLVFLQLRGGSSPVYSTRAGTFEWWWSFEIPKYLCHNHVLWAMGHSAKAVGAAKAVFVHVATPEPSKCRFLIQPLCLLPMERATGASCARFGRSARAMHRRCVAPVRSSCCRSQGG